MVAPVSEHGRLRRDGFVTTDGGCISYNIGLDKTSRQHLAMSIALGMILRDGLDAAEVHRAMWQIEDYRNGVPRDTPPPTDTPAPPWY